MGHLDQLSAVTHQQPQGRDCGELVRHQIAMAAVAWTVDGGHGSDIQGSLGYPGASGGPAGGAGEGPEVWQAVEKSGLS